MAFILYFSYHLVYVLLECFTSTCYVAIGNFRVIVGENKNKVRSIVSPLMKQFDHVYHGSLNTDYLFIGHHHLLQTCGQVKHTLRSSSSMLSNEHLVNMAKWMIFIYTNNDLFIKLNDFPSTN